MSEMIERVARAICEAGGHDPSNMVSTLHAIQSCNFEYPAWEDFRAEARAAIEAMRDPDPMMLAMAWRRFDMRGSGSTPAFKEVFNCMIDTALNSAGD